MDAKTMKIAHEKVQELLDNMEKIILGKRQVLKLTLTALLADGHILFEDVPGVGKTTLIKALAASIQGSYGRIQFTPDLLPGDILGSAIYNSVTHTFEFKEGPVFTTVLLADEINRATPRAQSALLEVMSERQVTLDGTSYPMEENFFVLATQNPIEYEGTYPLPEAQLDRFLFCLSIGYPDYEAELELLKGTDTEKLLPQLKGVLTLAELSILKKLASEVHVTDDLYEYALSLILATRNQPEIRLGASPRGGLAFLRAAKAYALVEGRNFCVPDDFKAVFLPTFAHRIFLSTGAFSKKETEALLQKILQHVPVPL
ncbi:AAA family ATPase [Enterococcus nangangensis]|uniref:AAA family ATPase n=1 Tax=Enterococcus nangangensis TaxID=2559926 RepID=UPI001FE9095A|nr:MoxR family ATPase [Enterococcus nangangensis]